MSDDALRRLAVEIKARRQAAPESSYTRQLLDAGPERCAQKLGEEAFETVIAALGDDRDALREEAADLIYHLFVLLEARGVAVEDVLDVVRKRAGTSGLAEKAARADKR